jgi:hypothetical protein
MSSSDTTERLIHIHLIRHQKTGLLAAVSDDLHGLVVHGKSPDDIFKRLSAAVSDLIEAEGMKVLSVSVERDERLTLAGYGPPAFLASAAIVAHRDA